MGNIFSDENTEQAIQNIEDLIWESAHAIELKHVSKILKECNINTFSALSQLQAYMVMKEEEHDQKCSAFLKNNVIHMHNHHLRISYRYGRVKFLIQIYKY